MIPQFNKGELVYYEHVSRYFFASQFVKNKLVLDVACGSGYGSYYLLEKGAKQVVGIDIDQKTIEYAKKRYKKKNLIFIKGSAENLPLQEKAFDLVVSLETIEHLKNQHLFLKEIKRVLRKDGLFVMSTPNALVYPKGNIFHTQEFTPKRFETLLLRHFKNLRLFYQNNTFSNYVMGAKDLTVFREAGTGLMEINLKNAGDFNFGVNKNMFLVGIATDGILPNTNGNCILFNPTGPEKSIEMEQRLRDKTLILETIYESRGWKIISFLHNVRIKIPILKSL